MWYFDDPIKVAELRKELDSWIGTPFRHHAGVKQVGCDCIHFMTESMKNVGVLKEGSYAVPAYKKDAGWHTPVELVGDYLGRSVKVKKIADGEPLMDGDILVVKIVNVPTHVAIYLDGSVYQAMWSAGISKMSMTDPKLQQIAAVYRVIA